MDADQRPAEHEASVSSSARVRSSSVGAAPRPKRLFTSRAQSAAEAALDVRCACQFFQTNALLPDRVNPIGSRPTSSLEYFNRSPKVLHTCMNPDEVMDPEIVAALAKDDLGASDFSFGPVLGDTDYYAESVSSRPNSPMHRPLGERPPPTYHQPDMGVGSRTALDPSIEPRPLHQKDPSTSILLQRRSSQTQLERGSQGLLNIQRDPNTSSILLQRRTSQRSTDNITAPIRQRDPSTSSLVRRKMGQSMMASRSGSQYDLENSFIPIQAQAPLSSSVSPSSRRPRGPYPGEAYPPDYEQMQYDKKPDDEEANVNKTETNGTRSFGIGIVDLMALGTSLVQSRKSRYTQRSSEDVRGRSRKQKRQERAEQAAQKKEEARLKEQEEKLAREAEKEAKEIERQQQAAEKEAEKEALRRAKEEEKQNKEAALEAERIQKAAEKEAERESLRRAKEEESQQKEAALEAERQAKEHIVQQEEVEKQMELLKKEQEQLQNEAAREAHKLAKEEEKRIAEQSKEMERVAKAEEEMIRKESLRQEKEMKKEQQREAKEAARRQSAASKESERLAREELRLQKEADRESVRLRKEEQKEADREVKEMAKLKKEQEKEATRLAKEIAKAHAKFLKEGDLSKENERSSADRIQQNEPVAYIGSNIYVSDSGPTSDPRKSSSPRKSPPAEPEPVVNYHEIIENTQVSVPVNTLIASLVHTSFKTPGEDNIETQVRPSPEPLLASNRPSRYSASEHDQPHYMRQRDPSQSSLLRKRYSESQDRGESSEPQVVRQRDLSQSSLLRRHYSTDTNSDQPQVMRQRDPSQSSLLRRRYPSEIYDSGPTVVGVSQQDQPSPGPQYMRQRDPSQSSLLRKRYSESAERTSIIRRESEQDSTSYGPAEKISKNVSFEYDKELESGAYDERSVGELAIKSQTTEMRDKQDWLERTYNLRDHEYEPIGEPADEVLTKSESPTPRPAVDQTYEPIQDPDQERTPTDVPAEDEPTAQSIQDEMEQHFNTAAATAPETIEVEEEDEPVPSPTQLGEHRKSFMETANDRTRQMKDKLSSQAGALRTKIRSLKKPPRSKSASPHESPKAKERKKFRGPEFSKIKNIHMPKIHKPDFKRPEFKRPEFTKFKTPEFKINLPDRPKFKLPASLKRSKSVKDEVVEEPEPIPHGSTSVETANTEDRPPKVPVKKGFSFGTYPRIFDRMRKSSKTTDSSTAATISRDDDRDEEEESDRMRGPVQFGTFPKMGRQRSPGATASSSHWSGNASNLTDNDSGQYQRYSSEPEGMERETSVERRMRVHLKNTMDYAEDDGESSYTGKDLRQTEEQKQLADYDEENREIHEISRQRESEFRQRKPLVHQESDLASEAESGRGDFAWVESDLLRKRLQERTNEGATNIHIVKDDYVRDNDSVHGSTQETQSSGSSSHLRREGLLDEELMYEQEKEDEKDNFDRYISPSVREGLIDRNANTLPGTGRYSQERFEYEEDYDRSNETVPFDDEEESHFDVVRKHPRRAKGSVESEEYQQQRSFEDDEYDKTFPPRRPLRKTRREYSGDSHETDEDPSLHPVAAEYYGDQQPMEQGYPEDHLDDRSFYDNEHLELNIHDDIDMMDSILTAAHSTPPVAPKRNKKKPTKDIRLEEVVAPEQQIPQYIGRSISSAYIHPGPIDDVVVYRTEHEYPIPSDSDTHATSDAPPTPLPRTRSRSRSQLSSRFNEDNVSRGAESLPFDDGKYVIDMTETNGYAVIRKEPPPRPPAPIRKRGGSSRSLSTERPFSSLPRGTTNDELAPAFPARPTRNYSTIGPTRPARRTSIVSLTEPDHIRAPSATRSDATQYEEISNFDQRPDSRNLHSGNTLNKMKHRPLPPPPRPPRDRRSTSRKSSEPTDDRPKFDRGGGGERVVPASLEDTSRISSLDMEEVEEVEVACQTDPLPDDFLCDEFEIDENMRVLEPSASLRPTSKTLAEILKEEQQAELDRARQFADEESLSRGIQKFRDANQRSFSERSRGSDQRPKTPLSRPITPSALVVEKKVVLSSTETEASLTMRPFDAAHQQQDFRVQDSVEDDSDARLAEDTADTEDERIVKEALRRYRLLEEESSVDQPEVVPDIPQRPERVPIQATGRPRARTPEPVEEHSHLAPVEEKILNIAPQVQPITPSPISHIEPLQVEPLEEEPLSLPSAPPRRKSSDTIAFGPTPTTVAELDIVTEQRVQTIADPPLEVLPNGRLHVAQLEVDSLNVNALQASRILVSDLQAISLNSQDLECRSGNLVVRGIELPPGFIEEIVDRVRSSERESAPLQQQQPPPQETVKVETPAEPEVPPPPPARPPPPQSLYPSDYAPYSVPPASFYQLRDPTDDFTETLLPPHSPSAPRRRRHYRHHRDEASSDEEYSRERRRSHHETPRTTEPPSIADLSGQLIRACGTAIGRTGARIVAVLRASGHKDENGNSQDVNVGLVILIVIVAVLMMLGMGGGPGRAVHTHHWDYFNPPENEGRK